jgi:hypothetical protein
VALRLFGGGEMPLRGLLLSCSKKDHVGCGDVDFGLLVECLALSLADVMGHSTPVAQPRLH